MQKKNIIIGIIFFILIVIIIVFIKTQETDIKIITQIKNTRTGKTGEGLSNIDYQLGDKLEKITIIHNQGEEDLENYKYKDTDNKEKYNLDIKAGKIEIIKTEISKDFLKEIFKEEDEISKYQEYLSLIEEDLQSLPPAQVQSDDSESTGGLSDNIINNATSNNATSNEEDNNNLAWKIVSLNPAQINNSFDTFFKISGSNLQNVETLLLKCQNEEFTFPISIKSENTLELNISSFTLNEGSCTIGITINNNKYFSDKTVTIIKTQKEDSPIFLKKIVPNIISSEKDSTIVLEGKGFDGIVLIQIHDSNDNVFILDVASINKINNSVLSIKIPKEVFPADNYYFRFSTQNSIVSIPHLTFNITSQ